MILLYNLQSLQQPLHDPGNTPWLLLSYHALGSVLATCLLTCLFDYGETKVIIIREVSLYFLMTCTCSGIWIFRMLISKNYKCYSFTAGWWKISNVYLIFKYGFVLTPKTWPTSTSIHRRTYSEISLLPFTNDSTTFPYTFVGVKKQGSK